MTRYEIRDTRYEARATGHERRKGSALILAVVLTSLLAVVGVMFVMLSRIDNMSTSAVAENKDLNFAVDSVVAKIKQTLAEDVPGVKSILDPNNIVSEYQDYPHHNLDPGPDDTLGTCDDSRFYPGIDNKYGTSDDLAVTGIRDDTWLASLEPEWVDVEIDKQNPDQPYVYGWRHITDLYEKFVFIFHEAVDFVADKVKPQSQYWDSDGDRISFRHKNRR